MNFERIKNLAIEVLKYKLSSDNICGLLLTQYINTVNDFNDLISLSSEQDGFTRWLQHQELNKILGGIYCEQQECEMIKGFFKPNISSEESLFSGYPETTNERFKIQDNNGPLPDLIIGIGPEYLKNNIIPSFNIHISHDWGWEDEYGKHIESYNHETKIYTRLSMTGRTNYSLLIDDNGVTVL